MSYMKGDLLSRTRKLVKGLAKPTPVWLKAMEEAPPAVFPRCESKVKRIELPEDVYVKRFFKKHPDSLYHDPVKITGFDPPPARVFAWRVVELKEQGVSEVEAMAVADMEYKAEKKAKKKAYSKLKQINLLQGKEPPPDPYPSAIKEIQEEEKKYVRDRFFNPKIIEIAKRLAEENPDKQADRISYRHPFGSGRPGGWGNAPGSGGRLGLNNNFLNSGNYTGGGGRPGGWGDNNFLRNNDGGNINEGGGRPGGWGNSNFLNNSNGGNFSGGSGTPGWNNNYLNNSNGGNFSRGGGMPDGLGNSNFLNNSNSGNFSGDGGRPGGLGNSNFLNNSNGGNFSGDGGRPGGLGNSNFLNNSNVGDFSRGGGPPGGLGNSKFLNNSNGGNFSGDGGWDNNFPSNNNVGNNNGGDGRSGGWGNNNFQR